MTILALFAVSICLGENCNLLTYNLLIWTYTSRFAIADPTNYQRHSFQYIPYYAHAFEKYRWPATIALQGKN